MPPLAVPGASGATLLLGSPVRLTALVEALVEALAGPGSAAATLLGSGGGAVSPAVVIVAALLAFLPLYALLGAATHGARGHRARAGLLAAVAGLALALVASRTITGIGTQVDGTSSVLVTGWAGTGLSLMTAGLLASALAGADAARSALVHHSFGWRHLTLGVLGVVAVLVPLLVGGFWALSAQQTSVSGRSALVMALTSSSRQVPVIASEITASDAAGRVLVLTSTPEGMRVRLWHGDGTALTDTAPDVLLAQLRARTEGWEPLETLPAPGHARPDPDVAAGLLDPADAELADLAARAVTGQDARVVDALAAHGVAVVLLSDRPGDEVTATARAGLDATPGLEPLAATSTGTSWRVSPTAATESAAVLLRGADGAGEVIASSAGSVRTRLSASDSERTLVLAERADPAWSATLDGTVLASVEDAGWNQAFTVPAGAQGELVVEHGTGPARAARPALLAVWALTALAAIPVRRRRHAV